MGLLAAATGKLRHFLTPSALISRTKRGDHLPGTLGLACLRDCQVPDPPTFSVLM